MAFSPLTQLIALLSGTGKLINRGGAKGATSAADVTSTAIDADHQALDVSVKGAATVTNPNQLPSSLGPKTKAGSVSFTLATDSDPLPITTISEKTGSATINALNGTAAIAAPGANSVVVYLTPTSPVLTLVAEVLAPDGTTWVPTQFRDTNGVPYTTLANPAAGQYTIMAGGMGSQCRVRASLWTSGSVAVAFEANANTDLARSVQFARYVATNPALLDGYLNHLRLNSTGALVTHDDSLFAGEDWTRGGMGAFLDATPSVVGAWTPYFSGSGAKVGTLGINIKATLAGRLRRLYGINTHASAGYWLFPVNKGSAPVANDLPSGMPLWLPANSAPPSGLLDFGPDALSLSAGVSYAISTTPEKVTLPASSDCYVWAAYA